MAFSLLLFLTAPAAAQLWRPFRRPPARPPQNSQWATERPVLPDRAAPVQLDPERYPLLGQPQLDDVSMSPDNWDTSGQSPLADPGFQNSAWAQQFPAEPALPGLNFDSDTRYVESGVPESGAFQRAGRKETEGFDPRIPLPPSSQYRPDEDPSPVPPPAALPPTGTERYPLDLPDGEAPILGAPAGESNEPARNRGERSPLPDPVPAPARPPASEGAPPEGSRESYPPLPMAEPAAEPAVGRPTFRPDLGQRSEVPIERYEWEPTTVSAGDPAAGCDGCPPLRQLTWRDEWATRVPFVEFEVGLLRPWFQGNNAAQIDNGGVSRSIPFDFDDAFTPAGRIGWVTQSGHGVAVDYFQYDQASQPLNVAATGTASLSARIPGTGQNATLTASGPGQSLQAIHGIDLQQFGVSFFHDVCLGDSNVTFDFGIQYVSLQHWLRGSVSAASGITARLTSHSDMRALGPRAAIRWNRPLAGTRLSLYADAGGALLPGNRDEFLEDPTSGSTERMGADELITRFELGGGFRYRRNWGERRFGYLQLGYEVQSWLGGGIAGDPRGDFGFRGFTLGVGINH